MTVQIFYADTAVRPAPPSEGSGKCAGCAYRTLCLPSGLNERELAIVAPAFGKRRRLARGETLFKAGQCFGNLYAIRFGHFLTSNSDRRGRRYVTGFQLAGDLLGVDGIDGGVHAATAVALEDSEVCEIAYARLRDLLAVLPQAMTHFHRMLSHEIRGDQDTIRSLAVQRADERLASLLLNLSSRYAMRGFSPRRFQLRMSRDDIACHLGLTLETVSRLMSRFRERHLITLDRREVEIVNLPELEALAAGMQGEPA